MLQRKYAQDKIQNDHAVIRSALTSLAASLEERPESAEFSRWKYETLWSMEELLLCLRRHFYLEELLAAEDGASAARAERLQIHERIAREHNLLGDEMGRMVAYLRNLQYGDVLRQHHLSRQLAEFVDSVERHEHMEQSSLADLIQEFDKSGRLSGQPTFTDQQLSQWEEKIGARFPASYKQALSTGEYEKANFEFVEPFLESPALLIFARWNDVQFAFDTREGPDYPVVVLVAGMKPARSYENFLEWLRLVFQTTSGPNNPE